MLIFTGYPGQHIGELVWPYETVFLITALRDQKALGAPLQLATTH